MEPMVQPLSSAMVQSTPALVRSDMAALRLDTLERRLETSELCPDTAALVFVDRLFRPQTRAIEPDTRVLNFALAVPFHFAMAAMGRLARQIRLFAAPHGCSDSVWVAVAVLLGVLAAMGN